MRSVAIKSIKHIKCKPTKVYDIAVPQTSNFVLSNGLVVHNCKPYQYLRSTIYEKRLEMYENTLLTEELLGLERDNNSGKIDHSPNSVNSKDQSDAVCGAVWNASNNAEQFAFDYGEDMQIAVETNTTSTTHQGENISQQFEQELGKLLVANSKAPNNPLGFNLNNTNTKSTTLAFPYTQNGIVLW